jgi:phage baseplate assembly protein W
MDATQEARTLGRTFGLVDVEPGTRVGMDLDLAPAPGGGRDLALVSGVDALAQDLKVALLTPLGEDPFHPAFGYEGLLALTRGGGVRFTEDLLRLSTMRAVSADGRIRVVETVEVSRTDPERRAWRIDVEARTVTDRVVALTMGEVGSDG